MEMDIAFRGEDWERVEKAWTDFWSGELERPVVAMQSAEKAMPENPRWRRFLPQYGELPAEEIFALESERMARLRWHGDAFPARMMDFGPGSLASYMGASLEVEKDTVWFKPTASSLEEIEAKIDHGCRWRRRVHEILDCVLKGWGAEVQIIPSDVGGGLDILAALRGSEKLMLDFYDAPEEAFRLSRAITKEWLANFDCETGKIMKACRGCANWAPMFSKGRTYMLQCDFSYMISPKQFERYALPELEELCAKIENPFYHLDGKGQIAHLDAVLSVKKLKGVQWIPGAGQPDSSEWLELLAKIREAGKLCQIYTSPEGAMRVKRELGGSGFAFMLGDCGGAEDSERIFKELTR